MKINQKSRFAFSLIELSVVILIIGILVVGITQGSRIISEAKLKSVRALTNSSPVQSISDLAIWLDSTSEKSFDSSVQNGSAISNWYNIDPRDTNGKKALTFGSAPTYAINTVNGLPSVKFTSSSSQCMSIADGFDGDSENATIFLVFTPTVTNTLEMDLIEKWSGSGGYPYVIRSIVTSVNYFFADYTGSAGGNMIGTSARRANVTNIISARRVKAGTMQLWVNSTQEGSTTDTTGSTTNNSNLFLGCRGNSLNYTDGYFNEVIIFSRALKDSERTSVENYLKQKWGVK